MNLHYASGLSLFIRLTGPAILAFDAFRPHPIPGRRAWGILGDCPWPPKPPGPGSHPAGKAANPAPGCVPTGCAFPADRYPFTSNFPFSPSLHYMRIFEEKQEEKPIHRPAPGAHSDPFASLPFLDMGGRISSPGEPAQRGIARCRRGKPRDGQKTSAASGRNERGD